MKIPFSLLCEGPCLSCPRRGYAVLAWLSQASTALSASTDIVCDADNTHTSPWETLD